MAKTHMLRVSAGVVAAVLAVLLLVITSTEPVQAAFPGANGKIFYEHNNRIWSMNPSGTGQTELVGTNDYNYELQPAVSPDGSKIAYEYAHDIWVMNSDGTSPRPLTDQWNTGADDLLEPTWSPDGKKIAFSRNEGGPSTYYDIWVMNSDGSGQKNLTNTPYYDEFEPAWSPDGLEIAYTRIGCEHTSGNGSCIYKMNANGLNQTNLTRDGETKICQQGGAIDHTLSSSHPTWSPDSSKIAFEGTTSCGAGTGKNIWVMNRYGGEKKDLMQDDGTNDYTPNFSPDGQKIAFMSDRAGSLFGDYEIYVIDANGVQPLSGLQRLTRDEGVHDAYPDWQAIPRAGGSSRTYSAVGDFSATQNPSGAWRYGRNCGWGSFCSYTKHSNPWGAGVDRWSTLEAPEPMVAYNGTGRTASYLTINHPADMLNLHPGPTAQKSLVRWAAPFSGTVKIEGRFQGIDTHGTTTDVGVHYDSATSSASLFSSNVNGYGARAPFSITKSVATGDRITFYVGYGSNRTYFYDSTGLSVTITPIL